MSDETAPPTAVHGTCSVCGEPMQHSKVCIACGHERPTPRSGVTVGGKYLIGARLGGGGMGEVYTSENIETHEKVAIKFLLGHWARVPEFRKRFKREAVAMARLRHPGIVSLFDSGEHEDDLYMVMELVRGESLGDIIKKQHASLGAERIAMIFDQILEALTTAHAAGIVHRDLKPDNVMVTKSADGSDRTKLLDFGLASVEEGVGGTRLTASGAVQGTPVYMSPEQCRGQRVGPPTDLYSVGVMLFEALTGAPPFTSDNMAGYMAQHMFVEPRSVKDVDPTIEVPPALEALVRHALAKDAAARPTAAQMRTMLAEVMSGRDAMSLAAHASEVRAQTAGLSREERGIGASRPTTREPSARPTAGTGDAPRVVVWANDDARGRGLRDALAVNGFSPSIWSSDDLPALDGVASVILVADPRVGDRARALRAASKTARMLVVGAADATQMTQLIRLGANDVTLATVGDDDVCRKAWRLVKRGR